MKLNHNIDINLKLILLQLYFLSTAILNAPLIVLKINSHSQCIFEELSLKSLTFTSSRQILISFIW